MFRCARGTKASWPPKLQLGFPVAHFRNLQRAIQCPSSDQSAPPIRLAKHGVQLGGNNANLPEAEAALSNGAMDGGSVCGWRPH